MAKQKAEKSLPKVSILERRLLNPFGSGSVPITLKTEGEWEIRWVFSKLRSGHVYNMVHNKGWQFVEPGELMGSADEYGLTAKDNRLVRGDHGEEVLMKMPKEMFRQITKAKAEFNLGQLGKKQMAEAAAQATAKEHGDQAGDSVFNAFKHGDVVDKRGVDADLEAESA
jgi:hypothetical protein